MSLAEVLQLITGVLGVAVTIIAAAETRLVKRLRRAGATSPEAAVALPRLQPLVRWQLLQLTSPGRWWQSSRRGITWTRQGIG